MAAIKMSDIENSPFNKTTLSMNAKDLMNNSAKPVPETPVEAPVSIRVSRVVKTPTGTETTYTVSIAGGFASAKDLREVLEAIEYTNRSLWNRVKGLWKR